ncbi:MAG: YafY family transcriptional regulator [Burkholderiaceae bacterium]|nr:YafY family transcriptional regulator [Burkholderiaceae bacterium]
MRRADRLFRLVQLVRGRRLSTGEWLGARLEVSLRTVYRDIADLQAQGVPIEGEAGVGYRMGAGFELPPLMFTQSEAKALVACVRLAQSRLDPELAQSAEQALHKIVGALPAAARAAAESLVLHAPVGPLDARTRECLLQLRRATEARRKLRLHYQDLQGAASERIVRPLGCFYWDAVWTLAAWCELRQDFRNFRVDHIVRLEVQDEAFRDEPGRTLADLLRLECA